MPDTLSKCYIEAIVYLVELVKTDEEVLRQPQRLLPHYKAEVKHHLSYLRKRINSMCKVAEIVGATEGMIKEALAGKTAVAASQLFGDKARAEYRLQIGKIATAFDRGIIGESQRIQKMRAAWKQLTSTRTER
jgi:hypothetical protein